MITGVVTLSDQAGMTVNNTTISGTVNVLAGTHLNAPSYSMNGGTLSVELNAGLRPNFPFQFPRQRHP